MDAGIERAIRMEWSLSIIAKLVDTGRNEGWLAGEALGAREEVVAPQIPRGPLPTPMQHLRERLELSSLALDVLWFLACVELDPRVSQGAAVLNVMATELSVQMLGQLLDLDSEPGLLDELTELGLLELQSEPTVPIFRRAVRVSDRVLDLARDHIGLDRSLRGIAALASASEIRESTRALALELPVEVQSTIRLQSRTLLVATGSDGSGRRTLLNYAIAAGGFAALSVRVDGLATDVDVLQRQLRAIARECLLHRAWPVLLGIDRAEQRMPIIERALLSGVASPVFATAHEGAAYSMSRPVVTVPVERPTATARAAMWRSALPGASENVIADCAERYSVTPGLIVQSARSATALVGDVTRVDTHNVHVALRTHLDRS